MKTAKVHMLQHRQDLSCIGRDAARLYCASIRIAEHAARTFTDRNPLSQQLHRGLPIGTVAVLLTVPAMGDTVVPVDNVPPQLGRLDAHVGGGLAEVG